MPKVIDYPRSSFKSCLALAEAVSYLGGSCTMETCADKMNLKISGSFHALCSSSQKFRLVNYQKGVLQVTDLYKLIKHSYSDEEMKVNKIKAFLAPPVFGRLMGKFENKELPVFMLDKILIREFEIDPDIAGRIGNYFIDGCKELGLLEPGNLLSIKGLPESFNESIQTNEEVTISTKIDPSNVITSPSIFYGRETTLPNTANNADFSVHIVGPGTDVRITIAEIEDMFLLEAMVKKIRKKVEAKTI